MFQIAQLPLCTRLSKRQTLWKILSIIDNDLFALLVVNDHSYDWDIFCKVEEMWTYFDQDYQPDSPDWLRYERPDSGYVYDLDSAIKRRDYVQTRELVTELAHKTGVIC